MKARKLCALSLLLAVPLALAQTTTAPTTSATTTATTGTAPQPATSTVTADRLATEFSGWAGSPENSAALVTGLRSGTPITLTEPGSAGTAATTTTTTTFSPTTRPMGYGNIRIALSLARAQLASQGITNPTAAELQGALVGTPDGMTQGVLQMRSSGMGWGQIANSMGFKLGAVMSGKQTFATATTEANATTTAATGTSPTANAGQARKGVVTANGGPAGGASAGKSGATTAAGNAGKVTTGLGHAYGNAGGGVVNAGGVKAGGVAASSNAGGNGGGQGKGGGKS